MALVHRPPASQRGRGPNNMARANGGTTVEAIEGLSYLDILNECLDCGALFFDAHGRLTSLSPEAIRILALDPQAVLGQSCDVLPAPLASLVHEVLATDQPLRAQDVGIRRSSSTTVFIRIRVFRFVAPQGGPVVIAILNDLTAAQRLEVDIGRLERLANIGVLSASIAHEVRNALVAIKTFTQTTIARQPAAELGEVAQRELKRIESIVTQMLKLGGPSAPTRGPARLHEILDYALLLAQHQMTQKSIHLRREYNAPADRVNGDNFQLEQAFVNLILNAIEAMSPGGILTLRTHLLAPEELPAAVRETSPPRQLRVTVADTGVGIAPENLNRVFEPFFTTKSEGTGLGLAITRRILEEHQAVISVESALNRGASFHTFFAPLTQQ